MKRIFEINSFEICFTRCNIITKPAEQRQVFYLGQRLGIRKSDGIVTFSLSVVTDDQFAAGLLRLIPADGIRQL